MLIQPQEKRLENWRDRRDGGPGAWTLASFGANKVGVFDAIKTRQRRSQDATKVESDLDALTREAPQSVVLPRLLNLMGEGGDVLGDRRSKPSFHLLRRQLTFGLLVQPVALCGFMVE